VDNPTCFIKEKLTKQHRNHRHLFHIT